MVTAINNHPVYTYTQKINNTRLLNVSKDVEISLIVSQANAMISIHNDTALKHHMSAIFQSVSDPL